MRFVVPYATQWPPKRVGSSTFCGRRRRTQAPLGLVANSVPRRSPSRHFLFEVPWCTRDRTEIPRLASKVIGATIASLPRLWASGDHKPGRLNRPGDIAAGIEELSLPSLCSIRGRCGITNGTHRKRAVSSTGRSLGLDPNRSCYRPNLRTTGPVLESRCAGRLSSRIGEEFP